MNNALHSSRLSQVFSNSQLTVKRPAFERMQAEILAGEIRTIVVCKLDRLSRSLRDGINTLTDWLSKGVRVVSITQQLDFAGATGKLIASVLFAVAEMEQETRRERQAAGIANAKANGVYIGRRPGTTRATPSRAKELLAKGLSRKEIATSLGITGRSVTRYLSA